MSPHDEFQHANREAILCRAWRASGMPLCKLIAMAHAYHEGTAGLSSADVGDAELCGIVESYLAARR